MIEYIADAYNAILVGQVYRPKENSSFKTYLKNLKRLTEKEKAKQLSYWADEFEDFEKKDYSSKRA